MTILFRSGKRLEAFSDGVFAIAITLLILEIRVPSAGEAGTPTLLWHALLSRWPSYFALVLSFWTILVAWMGHHSLFQEVRGVTRTLTWMNGLFLLLITVIPFVTALVAEHLTHPSGRVAVAVYAALNILNSVTFLLLARASRTENPDTDDVLRFASVRSMTGLGLSVAALALAFFSPVLALLVVALAWLVWSFPRMRADGTLTS